MKMLDSFDSIMVKNLKLKNAIQDTLIQLHKI